MRPQAVLRCARLVLAAGGGLVALVAAGSPKPVDLAAILGWKRVQNVVVAPDGRWFAYQYVPVEGDGEVVVRSLDGDKEMRFPAGEIPGGPGAFFTAAPPRDLVFSDDSRWIAFKAWPTRKEIRQRKKEKRAAREKVVLVELATGAKTEFEKIRRFAFSGKNPGWLALHRYGAEAQGAPGAAASKEGAASTRPAGADLLLRDLGAGADLNVGNVAEFAFDKAGSWLAWVIDAEDKAGNGVAARNLATGAVAVLDSAAARYRSLQWTERGDGLAVLRGVEDPAYEDRLHTLVAFEMNTGGVKAKHVYDPKGDGSFPAGFSISPHRAPEWREDLSAVTFGIHEPRKKKDTAAKGESKPEGEGKQPAATKGEDKPDTPGLVLWHWRDERLPSMQQVQEAADKNFSYLCLYRVKEKRFLRLADGELRRVTLEPQHARALGVDIRAYERAGNLDGRRFQDLYAVNPDTGGRQLLTKRSRWQFGVSPDGTKLLVYEDGHFFAVDMATGERRNLTEKLATTFVDTESDVNVVKPPVRPIGWSSDSRFVLLSDNWDIWKVEAGGASGVNLTGNGKRDKIRYRAPFVFDPDQKGVDLKQPLYVRAYGEWNKKGGIARVDPDGGGARTLVWDDASFAALHKARDADRFVYSRASNQESTNYYAAGPDLGGARRLSETNPQQKEYLWTSGGRLIDYTSEKGDKLQASLMLPAAYEAGKRYPMVVWIYEKRSQELNTYPQPGNNGFSTGFYTSNGYAVLLPDIVYRVNDPGMSAVWCLRPAVKAAIATGVVDPERVGIHGHSWGGYQTAFIITQTKMFRAAVAGAPLTDMLSMYSSIYWNTGSANQPIFEASQGRFSGGYWENPEAYIRNSPVYHARNVTTPLMILHNDKDGAVDWTQGIEYFNTLRRLDKPVVMLQYKGENHGLVKPENRKDYTVRMKEFFDHHLMGKPAPEWLTNGVPHLKLQDHLEERARSLEPAAAAAR